MMSETDNEYKPQQIYFYASINVGEFNLLEPNIKFANLRKTNKA